LSLTRRATHCMSSACGMLSMYPLKCHGALKTSQ
jgi:hypothetical protein